jgi:UDP-perosamine 4-acetyltransferase
LTSSPKRAVIYGARRDGSARVLLDIISLGREYEIAGFLDDDAASWGQMLEGVTVLGGRELLATLRAAGVEGVAFAVGNNRARELVLEDARRGGLTPINAVHPRAIVAASVQMGVGIWIAAGAVVNPGSWIADGVVINTGATVDHDCRIGAYANISPGCHLSGRTIVGSYAFLGTGVVTLPDVRVGDGAVVGAGAVVVKHVEAGATVVGVPAHPIQSRSLPGDTTQT